MAHEETPLNMEAVCNIVGRLYLESQHRINVYAKRLAQAEAERNEALEALRKQRE